MDAPVFDDEDLSDLLREFDEAILNFDRAVRQFEEHLEQLKRRNVLSVCDSGIDESDIFDDEDLSDLLREFFRAVCQFEEHLEQLKRRIVLSVCDSGIDESDSASSSPGSNLNSSEENLTTQPPPQTPRVKLGVMRKLEELIAELDKILDEM